MLRMEEEQILFKDACVVAGKTRVVAVRRSRFEADDPQRARTHRLASTRGKAHAHLCVVALLGGCGWLSLLGGRRESGLPPTFVSVRSVVTDLSTCLAYVSAHLKHTCVKSYHNGTFL